MKKIYSILIILTAVTLIFTSCTGKKTLEVTKSPKPLTSTGLTTEEPSPSPEIPKGEDELKTVIYETEQLIKSIVKAASSDDIEALENILLNISGYTYISEIQPYADGIEKILEYLISFKSNGNDEKLFSDIISEYEKLENAELKLSFEDKDYFLAAVAIRERNRLKEDEIVITFAGDCSFGTYPQAKEENKFDYVMKNTAKDSFEYNFKNCTAFFNTDDLTVANNETAISLREKMQNKLWQIKSDPRFTPIYRHAGIETVNLANNHTMDCFQEGYEDTLKSLDENGIEYFDEAIPLIKEIKGKEIVFLGYSVLRREAAESRKQKVLEDIRKYKKEDNIVIVNMHWGVEYREQPVDYQKDYARAFIDEGADLIVGSHPHIMQGIELYKGKYILYSIGDFCFGGDPDLESRLTALFRIRINKDTEKIDLEIVPFYENSDGVESGYNNFQPLPLFGEEADKVISYLKRISEPLEYGVTEYNVFNPF